MSADLRSITDFEELIAYLGNELDWPVDDYNLDQLTFEYDADELGLKDEEAEKLKDGTIRQLRPLPGGQPFGIFFVEFAQARLPVVVLRRILNALVIKKRNSANPADRQRWDAADILFISAFGESDDREIAFAHFHKDPDTTELPILRVLGWDGSDTPLKTKHVAEVLKNRLHWPENPVDQDAWRKQWRGAFRHRLGHVIKTSSDLADALAHFARKIRDAATTIMAHESESKGQLRKLHRAFQSALIHDLTEEAFADTYAQTVTYGLLTAAISKTPPDAAAMAPAEQTALTQEDITAMVPVTNPFLKEMLQEFLKVGGRKGGVDFDELGINEVVELLRGGETDLPAILRDFGNRKPGEDPVIHFYETFLTAYNKKLKIQRGVFYTPNPVVSYIIRSVDELLKSEFYLEHGLADTITWGEFISRNVGVPPTLSLPPLTDEPGCTETISPDEFFVQILDPATGTATFPVEVIDVIFKYLKNLWKSGTGILPVIPGCGQDARATFKTFSDYWNEYVPKALLPRLHGYELMMAPYAIAHMKIGLKLAETGYRFQSDERARIFLTNALEPWAKQLPLIGFDALAHEAEAVNEIKRHKRFTVVVGNPPYSVYSSNQNVWIQNLMDEYKQINGERIQEKRIAPLMDDYCKFFRLSQYLIKTNGPGILGIISNHNWLTGVVFRGMRKSLNDGFNSSILDLQGNSIRKDSIECDENVFDIRVGTAVCISFAFPSPSTAPTNILRYAELRGTRESKYSTLSKSCIGNIESNSILSSPDNYYFTPQIVEDSDDDWNDFVVFDEIFQVGTLGMMTGNDEISISDTYDEALGKIVDFTSELSDEEIRRKYDLCDHTNWKLSDARRVKLDVAQISKVSYRPFDSRYTYFNKLTLARPQFQVNQPLREVVNNLGLCLPRQLSRLPYCHVFVTRNPAEMCFVSNRTKEQNRIYPLYLGSGRTGIQGAFASMEQKDLNFNYVFLRKLALNLEISDSDTNGLPTGLTPEDIFHYIYAVFHSPGYRSRYAEFLKIDFPRVPLTGTLALFRELSRLGGELVALHLLESAKVSNVAAVYDRRANAWRFEGRAESSDREKTSDGHRPPLQLEFTGPEAPLIIKPGWTGGTVWLDSGGKKAATTPGTSGFHGVPENVWNFHIGGYQVCAKWLKDRKGRTLTAEDIAHYHKIVIALSETIRLMAEIDEVIETNGGWPGAFQSATESVAP